ncbi:MAG: SDR family oxidoreductase [Haloplanus sp.]
MRLAILGCGYVGIELGRQLGDGHEVVGVRRSIDGLAAIRDAGFEAIQADVTDPESLAAVPDVDALVFAASSGGRDAEAARRIYVEGQRRAIEHFGARAEPPNRYLYTSSTGVYGDHGGDWVDESTPIEPTTEKTAVLAAAETVAREAAATAEMVPTVARLAGIYGPDRYRVERYLEGPITPGYRNLVHREDAAGAIGFLLERDAPVTDVLVVDDEPVDRWTFADWLAEACREPEPEKVTVEEHLAADDRSERATRRLTTDKRCSNERLRSLGYGFQYPTYREGYREAVAAYRRETA